MEKKLIVVPLMIAAAIIALFFLTACGSEDNSLSGSSQGTYIGEEARFTAEVTETTVEIYIHSDSGRALYWAGDWEDRKEVVVSQADKDALSSSLFGSGADSKEFKVTNTTLEFEFQAMGSTEDITLNKEN